MPEFRQCQSAEEFRLDFGVELHYPALVWLCALEQRLWFPRYECWADGTYECHRYQAAEAIPIRQSTFGSKHQFRSHCFNCSSKDFRFSKHSCHHTYAEPNLFKTARRPYLSVRPLVGEGYQAEIGSILGLLSTFLSSHRDVMSIARM